MGALSKTSMEIACFGILVALGAMANGIAVPMANAATETNSSCLCTCMYSFEGNTEPAIIHAS